MAFIEGRSVRGARRPILVLGTDDIASAIGHALGRAGLAAVLVRDPQTPVLRRGMSFDAAVEDGAATLEGMTAYAIDEAVYRAVVRVTAGPARTLMHPAHIEGVIDARMRRREAKADLRGAVGFAIGLGPGYAAGENCDIAIETAPEATGRILRRGETLAAHGRSAVIGGAGGERFARAPEAGSWRTRFAIGDAVEEGAVIGQCGATQVLAPLSGRLRGLVRDGATVPQGAKLAEVDPRAVRAQCHGIPPRAARMAESCVAVAREMLALEPSPFAAFRAAAWRA